MKGKLPLLLGLGLGYVLGSRAGRGHYDKLSDGVNKMWNDPRVQDKVEVAKAKAPAVASKLSDQAKTAGETVKAKVSGGTEGERDLPKGSELNAPTGTTADGIDYNRPSDSFGADLAAGDPAGEGVTSDNWAKTEDAWKKDNTGL